MYGDSSSPRRILVAVDASKHQQLVASPALNWTLSSFSRSGDVVRILGILQQGRSAQVAAKLGHKLRAQSDADPDEVCAANEESFAKIKGSCENAKIAVSLATARGLPARNLLLQDAKSFHPTWIIMDRFMKKEILYIKDQLENNLVLMNKQGRGDVKKLITPDECDVDSSDLFEIEVPLGGFTGLEESITDSDLGDNKSKPVVQQPTLESRQVGYVTTLADELQKPSGFVPPGARSPSTSPRKLSPDVTSFTPQPANRTLSCSTAPVSVQPTRHESEMLKLLGGAADLDTKLFRSYIEDASILQGGSFRQALDVDETTGKAVVQKCLDCYLSVDENHGESGNQGAAPLCHLCNNKSPRFGTQPIVFCFNEIEKATNKFASDNFIAEGGFGFVYKGILPDGQLVAVKQHKLASRQGDREFKAEVEVLSSAQHRNVVTLIGYCTEGGRRILVYEYVCNGSLNLHLSKKNPKPLDWPSRLNIALGAARGLRYLHEECRIGCIVHRDVRPNNILVTHEFTALVADFGLARWQASGDRAEQTRVIGTIGYVAPEYAETGQITEKADVYSFGLVLLEIITGRPAFDSYQQPGQQHLPDWATPFLAARAAYELLDKRIDESTVDEYELLNMVSAASLCIQKDPIKRPKMSQVVRHLEGDDRESTPLSPIAVHTNVNVEAVPSSKPTTPRTSVQFSSKPKLEKGLVPTRNSISYNEML